VLNFYYNSVGLLKKITYTFAVFKISC
jgi:hypothetical protein